ncbi:MAG: helix-turn-helix domain-containing protein [Planctomycetota bacterium]
MVAQDWQRRRRNTGELLGVSDRTVRRWQRRLEAEGDAGKYTDFGPTLAAESASTPLTPIRATCRSCRWA